MLAILFQTVNQVFLQNITSEDNIYYQIWLPEQGPSNKNQTYLQQTKTTKNSIPNLLKFHLKQNFLIAVVCNTSVYFFVALKQKLPDKSQSDV